MPTTSKIEQKAWRMLRKYNLTSAPVNMEELAESLDVQTSFQPMEEEISAMLLIECGKAHIVVNATHPPNRKRFSLAHELGHFALHASDANCFFVDRAFFRNSRSSIGNSREEIEANAFAAALLMPKKLVQKELPGDQNVEIKVDEMAKRFEVSDEAMTIRLIKLGHIFA